METGSGIDAEWRAFSASIAFDETNQELVLDVESPLERHLMSLGCLGLLFLGVGLLDLAARGEKSLLLWLAVTATIFGSALLYLRWKLQDVYLVSIKRQQVTFQRTFFGRTVRRRVCFLGDLASVVVQPRRVDSKSGAYWTYGLGLLRHGGELLSVLTPVPLPHQDVASDGETLARYLGIPLEPGQPESLLKIDLRGGRPIATYSLYTRRHQLVEVVRGLLLVVIIVELIAAATLWYLLD